MRKLLVLIFLGFFFNNFSESATKVPYFTKEIMSDNEKLQMEVADIYDFSYKGPFSTVEEITKWTLQNSDTHPESVKVIFNWLDKNPDSKESELIHPYITRKLLTYAKEDEKLKEEVESLKKGFPSVKDDFLTDKKIVEYIIKNKTKYQRIFKFLDEYVKIHKKSQIGEWFNEFNKK
jgi:hydroxymethylpyrimidine pyrophosphatase-like HAD family hydrolase